MEDFSKEEAFDKIIGILMKAGEMTTPSGQYRIYKSVMDELQDIADKNYERGFIAAVNSEKDIENN